MKNSFIRLVISFFVLFWTTNLMADKVKVDIIFVMDTSGSLDNEAPALVSATQAVTRDLSSVYDLDTKLWSITNAFDFSNAGFQSSVINQIPNATSNHYEDWGPATYDVATFYSAWRTDAIKIIVPISDEGPEDGDGLYQNDIDSINKARRALDATNIYAVPIIAQGYNGNQNILHSNYGLLLSNKAIKTGSGDLVAQFKTIISDIVSEASGRTLGSVNAKFIENLNGGKLILDVKGAKKYNVIAKFDGKEILSTTTTNSNIPITFPNGYDSTINHQLQIDYTAYAIDNNNQILDTKSATLTQNINAGNRVATNFVEFRTATKLESNPMKFASARSEVTYQAKSTSFIADPVDISSGNFSFSNNDLIIPTAGIPLVIKRFYNSLDNIRGWKFNIINSIDISDINNIKVSWQNGDSKDLFVKANNGWVSVYSTDTLNTEAGGYVITKSDGTKYKFDTSGKLIAITNKQDLGLSFEYVGLDIHIKDSFGTLLATVVRNNLSQITSITDSLGNTISYTYAGENLISYTNRNGDKETYEYSNNLINKISGNDGKTYVSNTYDSQGRVISQLNGDNQETTFTYEGDLANYIVNLVKVKYANGITRIHKFNLLLPTSIEGSGTNISFQYDENSNVKSITDTNSKTWSYERNSLGLMTKSTDPQGNTILYAYDANGNIISQTNGLGQNVLFEYDTKNNLIKATDADGKITSYEYNLNNQVVKITNALNQVVVYSYNAKGQLETVTLPNGAITTYTYNALGNVETIKDGLNRVVTYQYDKEGKVIKITNPLGYATQMKYNEFGDLIQVTDAKKRNTSMEYNLDGLLTKTTLVDGTTIESTYDVLGREIVTKDTLGREFKKEYDDFGRISKVVDAKGNNFELVYDNVGNVIKVIDAQGNAVQTTYDELYRPSKNIDANGLEVATTTYNALSIPTKIVDSLGKSVEFNFDNLNRLQESTLSGSIKAQALYDGLGNIIKTTDPKGGVNSYEYDSVGNLIKEINPLNKENVYAYDILGRVASTTTPNGVLNTFVYDDLDRIVKMSQRKDSIENNTTYTYDEVGNVLSVVDDKGTITYTYNVNDQVATRTDIYGKTVSYSYDQARRLSTLTYPDGKKVTYTYDDNDNLAKVKDFADRETLFEYDVNGNLIKTTHINGAYTLYTYDKNARLMTLKNHTKDGKVISSNEITRDGVGNIVGNKNTSSATVDISKVKNFNFEMNGFNQITKSADGDFAYDDNGNLLSYKYDAKLNSLVYDLSNNLTKATLGSDVYSYTYDAEGNRVSVNNKHYIVDNIMGLSKPLAETDSSNNIQKYYIWANGLSYSVDSSGDTLVYLYDYQGNTNAILDKNNAIKASYQYNAYGSLISADEKLDNPFKYLGQHGIQSDSNGLYYVRARYYSPQLNRWTQSDVKRGTIANPLSLNRYALNEGDAVNYVDVNGYERGKSGYKPIDNTISTSKIGIQEEFKMYQINSDVLKIYSEQGAILGCVSKQDGNFIMGKCGVSPSSFAQSIEFKPILLDYEELFIKYSKAKDLGLSIEVGIADFGKGVGAVVPIKIGKVELQVGARIEAWQIYNLVPFANPFGTMEEYKKANDKSVKSTTKSLNRAVSMTKNSVCNNKEAGFLMHFIYGC